MGQARPASPIWLRVLQFPLTRLVLLGAIFILLIGISNGFMSQFAASPLVSLVLAAGMAAAGLAVYYAFVRLVEQRQVHELGLKGMGRELGIGLLIGAGLCILCVLALMVLGVYRIDGINPVVVMLPALAMALSAGVLEELMYRGGLFRIVEESLGSWISLAVSALVFGLSHYAPVDGALWGSFAITIEAGLLLAAAYMLTRRLWISIGLHVAWNFAQSGVFSGIVSGSFNQPGLFKSTLEGSDWLTGGAFGMEASLVAVVVCTAAGLLLLMLAMRRGHLVPPFWLRARPDPIMPTA
jgi:membrane protease YdiL (CAAX protease family)